MHRLVTQLWYRRDEGLLSRLLLSPLWLLSIIYGAIAAIRGRRLARRARRVGARVISVGNLTAGGAGKTPVAIYLARRLVASGQKTAVLSRGYGGQEDRSAQAVVSDGEKLLLTPEQAGDEPVLIARAVPQARVMVSPDRAALAEVSVAWFGTQAIVLDDGFQHRRLARDVDIVVVDGSNPFGNGALIPRGPLREPLSALRRASLAWISKADQAPAGDVDALAAQLQSLTGKEPVRSRYRIADISRLDGASLGVAALTGKRVLMLAGVARPESFRATLASAGALVVDEAIFPDHHRFTPAEVARAVERAKAAGAEFAATTEKDAVRLPAGAPDLIRVVKVELEILSGEQSLAQLL
jgi:tetraacyldisaccharide 4'-kinase